MKKLYISTRNHLAKYFPDDIIREIQKHFLPNRKINKYKLFQQLFQVKNDWDYQLYCLVCNKKLRDCSHEQYGFLSEKQYGKPRYANLYCKFTY